MPRITGVFDRAVGDDGRRHHARAAPRRQGQRTARRVRHDRGRLDGVRAVPVLAGLPAGERSRRRYREPATFYRWAVAGVLAIVPHAVSSAYSTALSHRAAFTVLHDLRVAIAKRVAGWPLGFFGGRRSGDVKKLMIDEAEKLELLLAHGIPDVVAALSVWVGVSVWLVAVDWRLALASVFLSPVAFWCMNRAITSGPEMMADYQAATVRMNGSVVEYLSGMPVVKVFSPHRGRVRRDQPGGSGPHRHGVAVGPAVDPVRRRLLRTDHRDHRGAAAGRDLAPPGRRGRPGHAAVLRDRRRELRRQPSPRGSPVPGGTTRQAEPVETDADGGVFVPAERAGQGRQRWAG